MRYYAWIMSVSHKVTATALIITGFCFLLLPAPWLYGYTPTLGPWWQITHMEVLFYHDTTETYTDIASFRKMYPGYGDISGEELARRLHRKYFGDKDFKDYSARFFATGAGPASPPAAKDKHSDPFMLRGEIEAYTDLDPITQGLLMHEAAVSELYDIRVDKMSVPYMYPFSAGIVLLALGMAVAVLGRSINAGQ